MMKSLCRNPFRLFFPMGILFAFWGTYLWLNVVFLRPMDAYPGLMHRQMMMGGFVLSFVTGFLMTAIPRFTETSYASWWEILLSFGGFSFLACLWFFKMPAMAFYGAGVYLLLVLVLFVAPRFLRRKSNPPHTFLFVGLGLFLGILGLVFSLLPISSANLNSLGHALFYEGMILSLILGVGGRLIPGILGHTEIVQKQRREYESEQPFLRLVPWPLWGLLFIFCLSYIFMFFEYHTIAYGLRLLVTLYIAFSFWKLYALPAKKTRLNYLLWLSCWFVVLGLSAKALFPLSQVHWIHLFYIGGVGLMILMVATRVTLAHGDEGMDLEHRSAGLPWIGGFIIIAAFTRAIAPFFPESFFRHLGYSSLCWIIALALWGGLFLPKIFKWGKSAH